MGRYKRLNPDGSQNWSKDGIFLETRLSLSIIKKTKVCLMAKGAGKAIKNVRKYYFVTVILKLLLWNHDRAET